MFRQNRSLVTSPMALRYQVYYAKSEKRLRVIIDSRPPKDMGFGFILSDRVQRMSLVPYDVASEDKSVLWTESKKDDQSYRYIRRASVIAYHMTANNHEIHDGRIVDLSTGTHISEWWKFTSYNKDQLCVTISCRSKEGYNLTIRDDTVMLAPADSKDKYQAWMKDISYGNQVKDEDNRRSFALVNKATGKAIKHGFGPGYLVQLAPFNPNYLDVSLLWTEDSKDLGFRQIRMQTNKSVVFHAFYVHQPDSTRHC